MALFGLKKNTKETAAPKKAEAKKVAVKAPAKVKTASPAVMHTGSSTTASMSIIIRPHITEKAGMLSQNNIYTFEIAKDANKKQVSDAIFAIYKVRPTRVSVAVIRSKVKLFRGGIKGKSASRKKAYVYLKEGDKIEFI